MTDIVPLRCVLDNKASCLHMDTGSLVWAYLWSLSRSNSWLLLYVLRIMEGQGGEGVQRERETETETERQTETQTDGRTEDTDTQTDRQTDRQAD